MNTSTIFKEGNTAVITGASSGIGLACAVHCASKGMHTWMLDIDEEDLPRALQKVQSAAAKATAATAAQPPTPQTIESIICNVTHPDQLQNAAQKIFDHESTTSVHFLMNNAAIQLGGGYATTMDVFQKVLNVNTFGPIHGCQAFLPLMQEKGMDGLIVNTGSKQGITAPPGNLTYNVSKAALKTWTEGLEHELMKDRTEKGGKLYAALLIPGWVNTSIHLKEMRARAELEGRDFDKDKVFFHEDKPAQGAWMPSQVIEFMMEELDKGRFYIVCPDNDVDRETDNIRMTWAMEDITKNRAPLSRWHPEWADKFKAFLASKKK